MRKTKPPEILIRRLFPFQTAQFLHFGPMTDRCRLYLITPPQIELGQFPDRLRAALDGGDVACLQLRLKETSDEDIARAAEVLMPLAHAHDTAFLINDRPDLAAAVGADGVHIGQDDLPFEAARKLMGADKIVGVTCHASRHLAMEAGEAGADYVAFGAFFPTTTKTPKSQASLELLTWWNELFEVPCVAIGGMTVENCAGPIAAGADFLAVSAGIWDHLEGPGEAVAAFNRQMKGVS